MSGRADVVHRTRRGPEPCSDADPAPEGGSTVPATWPLDDALTLGALPTAPAPARRPAPRRSQPRAAHLPLRRRPDPRSLADRPRAGPDARPGRGDRMGPGR